MKHTVSERDMWSGILHEGFEARFAAGHRRSSICVAINNREYLERLSQETGQCLRGEDLEQLTNVSAAAHQEMKSFVHEQMSGVISLAEKYECSEGRLPCGKIGICLNTVLSCNCSCPPGFTWDGSQCIEVDECAEGKDDCVPNATCKNSIGSYSCSCNKPFEGDGKTSCELFELSLAYGIRLIFSVV
ncbi:pro-epidermal growth factor-like [Palaemon carinicauda]|uniref:pro-epidermal growth factor-like n=1 Tax=Palaemon carinicauda TaxID=392227 RepID=UPI0035B662A8